MNGIRPHQLRGYVDENTIGVVAILGVTYTCDYEPVEALAAELDAIESDTGIDVPLHVDAASGGFVAPFVQPGLVWDFRIPRVKSINASGHKYGMAPLGVGWAVWRHERELPEELVFRVSYLGGDMPTFALNFSRPGNGVVAQYFLLLRLGREGYRQVQQRCLETAVRVGAEVAAMECFQLLYDGRGALPAISYTLRRPADSPFDLYQLSDQLRQRGWQVPAYPLPADRSETVIHRVLIRHDCSDDRMELFLRDLRHSVSALTTAEGGPRGRVAFHH
ncbi:pyridoxal-dependent decarboxylase [Streptomyces gossypii]|uniref:pyridoxal-dependent decarboxylase n=1 Tax=Streptomyces gossypii TaxID=2883101 RepID=UPI0021A2BCE9